MTRIETAEASADAAENRHHRWWWVVVPCLMVVIYVLGNPVVNAWMFRVNLNRHVPAPGWQDAMNQPMAWAEGHSAVVRDLMQPYRTWCFRKIAGAQWGAPDPSQLIW